MLIPKKRNFNDERLWFLYIDEPGAGDGAGGGGETPPSDVPPSDGAGETPPSGGEPPASGAGEPAPHILDGAPERGSQEYIDWFNSLEHDDQVKVEQGWNEGYEPKAKEAPPAVEDKNKPTGDGTGDNEDVGEWTPEEFSALDVKSQNRIKAMQGIIKEFEPYLDGSLDKGMEIIEKDPFIQARLEEIKNKGPLSVPESVSEKFDASKYLSEDDRKSFEMLDDKGKQGFTGSLQKAFEHGAKVGGLKEKYASEQKLLVQSRVTEFTNQLNKIVNDTPSLSKSVPKDENGNPVPFSNENHPLNAYLKWAGGSDGLGDDWLAKHGHKAGYAAYLAATGKHDEAMQNVARTARTNFIANLESMQKRAAATPGGGSQTPPREGKIIDGIDMNKYTSDQVYRRSSFEGANYETRRKLEQYMYENG